ncbi:hypothetical protein EDM53_01295 [Rickettsiales endosymbiont of Peranema trichophorum]|uniref:hypothetical protein n=1 Tax=Rickettsiales endosymbiont of Peranema trichophorum TaxID=2486577 RepID=UPI0010230ADF|nr:hypothetical protein [Rickettsiales endosymbiont of Peranema trichophorum]RZI47565.1 hypothetical protein EDM53_01295 [Rickettsiales endosymbiont of Peranema trichophorum]
MVKDLKQAKDVLMTYGVKEDVVEQLNGEQIHQLIAFCIDWVNEPRRNQWVSELALMELSGKGGAAFLASTGIASVVQLRNLTCEQIVDILEEYDVYQDEGLAMQKVRDSIISNQQMKLELHSGIVPSKSVIAGFDKKV